MFATILKQEDSENKTKTIYSSRIHKDWDKSQNKQNSNILYSNKVKNIQSQ